MFRATCLATMSPKHCETSCTKHFSVTAPLEHLSMWLMAVTLAMVDVASAVAQPNLPPYTVLSLYRRRLSESYQRFLAIPTLKISLKNSTFLNFKRYILFKLETLCFALLRGCGNSRDFYIFPCQTNIRQFSVRFRGPNFFSSLSHEIQTTDSVGLFEKTLKDYLLL